jgi:putative heme-binding domain-containing protein
LFESLVSDARFRNGQAGQEFLRELAVMIGTQKEGAEVGQTIDFIARGRLEPGNGFGLLADLSEGLARAGTSLPEADGRSRIGPFYQAALDTALATDAARPLRAEALRLLRYGAYSIEDIGDLLSLMLDPSESEVVRSAVIETLMRFNDSRAAAILFQRWEALTPASKDVALNLLLARRENAAVLVAAIEAGTVPRADLSSIQVNFLRTYPDPIIAQRAVQLFGQAEPPRTEVLSQFARALKTVGSAANGRQIFQNRCADCHEIAASRPMPGPALTKARAAGRQKLLEDILDPGRRVRGDYATWVLESKTGENLVGVLADPNGIHAILRQSDGESVVVPRDQIANLSSRPWSLMPTDAAQGMSVQQMADLMEYVMTAK